MLKKFVYSVIIAMFSFGTSFAQQQKKYLTTMKVASGSPVDLNSRPLLIVDGEVAYIQDLDSLGLNQEDILKIDIDKTADAMKKYGEAGKHGVIEVTTKNAVKEEIASDKLTEEQPSYPGGDEAMYMFLAKNIRYPEKAVIDNVQGVVNVKFMVLKDGSMEQVHVDKSDSELLNDESLRVVKLIKKFNPGKKNGEPVDMWYTLPISFKMTSI